MSAHLKLMVDEQLFKVRARERHRYFTLADGHVAHALEALLRVAASVPTDATSWAPPAYVQPAKRAHMLRTHGG